MGNHHDAAREHEERVLEGSHGLDIEIVGRLVEEQQVAADLEDLRELQPAALAARELADPLLLVGALEVEPSEVGAARDLVVPDPDDVLPAGDFLEHGVVVVELVPELADVSDDNRAAD